jgi:hypothetical protein
LISTATSETLGEIAEQLAPSGITPPSGGSRRNFRFATNAEVFG